MKNIEDQDILDILNGSNECDKDLALQYLINIDNKCIMKKIADRVDWYDISKYQSLSEEFIREFQDKVEWNYIFRCHILSESFIREFQYEVNWYCISLKQTLSEEFIREFKDKVDWGCISGYQLLSEEFIREFKDRVEWSDISSGQKISEPFIREFQDEVYWSWISMYQKLSEDFIREFQDVVDWDYISEYQILSEDFIREFQDVVDWDYIFKYQILSKKLIKESINRLKLKKYDISSLDNLDDDALIKNFQEVKVYNNDIYGYKVLDYNNRSTVYSKLYELNKETELVNCDTSNTTCSFGYNFYLRLDSINYNDEKEKILKVLVKKEDIGVILDEDNIGRCYKLTPIQFIK